MIDLFSLSALNTLRNTRRSLITIFSIAIGCAALCCFGAFINFTFEGLRETTIHTQLGHIQVYAKGYWEHRVSNPTGVMIRNVVPLETALRSIPGVSTVTHRVSLSGIASVGKASVSVAAIGVDPEHEMEFSDFETVVEGRNLMPGDTDVGVIGTQLATGLGAKVGDRVTVLTSSLEGLINAIEFRIAGIVQTGSTEYDSVYLKVPVGLVQQALDTTAAERVIVLLKNTDDLPVIEPKINAVLSSLPEVYETRTWLQLANFYEAVVGMYTGLFRVLAGIVAVVVMFSVANTIAMSVLERTGESGALRAMGADQGTIILMFLLEGLIIGIVGGLCGVGISLLLAFVVAQTGGIPMPPPPAMSQGYQAFFSLTPSILGQGFLVSVIGAFLSSLYPAWDASRINIVKALQ